MDAMNMDTVCRLYEVGRQRLAEDEEDEEEDQVSGQLSLQLLWSHLLVEFPARSLNVVGWFLNLRHIPGYLFLIC